jgi:hypothetical protein
MTQMNRSAFGNRGVKDTEILAVKGSFQTRK